MGGRAVKRGGPSHKRLRPVPPQGTPSWKTSTLRPPCPQRVPVSRASCQLLPLSHRRSHRPRLLLSRVPRGHHTVPASRRPVPASHRPVPASQRPVPASQRPASPPSHRPRAAQGQQQQPAARAAAHHNVPPIDLAAPHLSHPKPAAAAARRGASHRSASRRRRCRRRRHLFTSGRARCQTRHRTQWMRS